MDERIILSLWWPTVLRVSNKYYWAILLGNMFINHSTRFTSHICISPFCRSVKVAFFLAYNFSFPISKLVTYQLRWPTYWEFTPYLHLLLNIIALKKTLCTMQSARCTLQTYTVHFAICAIHSTVQIVEHYLYDAHEHCNWYGGCSMSERGFFSTIWLSHGIHRNFLNIKKKVFFSLLKNSLMLYCWRIF